MVAPHFLIFIPLSTPTVFCQPFTVNYSGFGDLVFGKIHIDSRLTRKTFA